MWRSVTTLGRKLQAIPSPLVSLQERRRVTGSTDVMRGIGDIETGFCEEAVIRFRVLTASSSPVHPDAGV